MSSFEEFAILGVWLILGLVAVILVHRRFRNPNRRVAIRDALLVFWAWLACAATFAANFVADNKVLCISLLVASQLVFVVVLALHQPQDGAKTKPPEPRFAPDTSVRPLVIAVVCVLGLALAGILFGQG